MFIIWFIGTRKTRLLNLNLNIFLSKNRISINTEYVNVFIQAFKIVIHINKMAI